MVLPGRSRDKVGAILRVQRAELFKVDTRELLHIAHQHITVEHHGVGAHRSLQILRTDAVV